MDLSIARVATIAPNRVRIYAGSWEITAQVENFAGRPMLVEIGVKNKRGAVTSTGLGALPLRQITVLAASAVWGGDETLFRMLASPLPPGVRSWPPEHYERVRRVAVWASGSGRRGGAEGAVSEFWSVSLRTARRWLARAKVPGARDRVTSAPPGRGA